MQGAIFKLFKGLRFIELGKPTTSLLLFAIIAKRKGKKRYREQEDSQRSEPIRRRKARDRISY